jgi:hypothetical protein
LFFVEGRDPDNNVDFLWRLRIYFIWCFLFFVLKDASLIATLPSSGVDVYGVFDGHGPVGELVSRCVYCSNSTSGSFVYISRSKSLSLSLYAYIYPDKRYLSIYIVVLVVALYQYLYIYLSTIYIFCL